MCFARVSALGKACFMMNVKIPRGGPRMVRSFLARRSSSTGSGKSLQESIQYGGNIQGAAATGAEESCHLPRILRHGPGDSVVLLNVGGKEFVTLRSTIESNHVLSRVVEQAESNQELTKGNAVFIDRDPGQFHLILQHLRNKIEDLTYRHSSTTIPRDCKNRVYIRLPEDGNALRDLYIEAEHFQIQELQHLICKKSIFINMASIVNGKGGNPFDSLRTVASMGRSGLVATVGTLGLFLSTQQQQEIQQFMKRFNLTEG